MKSIAIEYEAKRLSELNFALNEIIQNYIKTTPNLFDLVISWDGKKVIATPHIWSGENPYKAS